MEAPARVGPPPAKSNPTGTPSGWPIRPACWKVPGLLDAPPHHVSAEETIEIGKQYEFLVLFTSTPGFGGDCKLAAAMKAANPGLKIAFVGPHVTTLPEQSLRDGPAIDFVVRREFDWAVVEFANGKPLEEILGVSYREDEGVIHNPDRPAVADLDALPNVTDVYKRDSGRNPLQRALSYASLRRALHDPRMPGTVYLLPLAADFKRTSMAQALRPASRGGNGESQGVLAQRQGVLFR